MRGAFFCVAVHAVSETLRHARLRAKLAARIHHNARRHRSSSAKAKPLYRHGPILRSKHDDNKRNRTVVMALSYGDDFFGGAVPNDAGSPSTCAPNKAGAFSHAFSHLVSPSYRFFFATSSRKTFKGVG